MSNGGPPDFDLNDLTDEDTEHALVSAYDAALAADQPFLEVTSEEVEGRGARVVLAFVGTVAAGKSSLLKALFGHDPGDIDPIEGSTDRCKFFEHPRVPNLFLVDTPGLADVQEARSLLTLDTLPEIDVVVFVIDKADTTAVKDFRHVVVDWKRPACVVRNKIDLVHESQRKRVLDQVRTHFSVAGTPTTFGVCAGGEPPATATLIEPFGLDPLVDWIFSRDLSEAQRLRVARGLADRERAASYVIGLAVTAAATVGAVPVPGADIIPLTGIQVTMIRRIGDIYDQPMSDDLIRMFVQQLVGQLARLGYRLLLQAARAAGWAGGPAGVGAVAAIGAAVASATTYGIGVGAREMCRRDLWGRFEQDRAVVDEVARMAVAAVGEYRSRKR